MDETELRGKLMESCAHMADTAFAAIDADDALAHAQAACALSEALAYLPGDPDPAVPQAAAQGLSEDAKRLLLRVLDEPSTAVPLDWTRERASRAWCDLREAAA